VRNCKYFALPWRTVSSGKVAFSATLKAFAYFLCVYYVLIVYSV
jgi:hypothetical protein